MVSRLPENGQIWDLQNAKSTTALNMSFVADCCAEKKEDKINTDDKNWTYSSPIGFIVCSIIKIRRLMITWNLIDTPYKDIRLAIQN